MNPYASMLSTVGVVAGMANVKGQYPASGVIGPGKRSRLAYPDQPLYRAGRNDPCPCGSGKKFKKCCISKTI